MFLIEEFQSRMDGYGTKPRIQLRAAPGIKVFISTHENKTCFPSFYYTTKCIFLQKRLLTLAKIGKTVSRNEKRYKKGPRVVCLSEEKRIFVPET